MPGLSTTKLVALSAWLSRLCTSIGGIYSMRVLNAHLSLGEYASLIIIVSIGGWYALTDFGLGYATQNSVTRKSAIDKDASEEILAAYTMLAGAATLFVVLTIVLSAQISSVLFQSLAEEHAGYHASTLRLAGIILTLGVVSGISGKILYAQHKGYVANLATAVGSLISISLLVLCLPFAQQKMEFAVIAIFFPGMFISMIIAILQIAKARQAIRIFRRLPFLELLRSAKSFFIFYLLAAAVLQVDYIIMSQKISPSEILQYYGIAKIFTFSSFFNQALMMAMWPKFTEQFVSGNLQEISWSIDRLIVYGVLLTASTTICFLLISEPLSKFLYPSSFVEFRYEAILGFGALALVRGLVDPFAVFLQSAGVIKPLIIFASIQAAIGGMLQWVLADYFSIEGILIALVLSALLTSAWGLPYCARKRLTSRE